MTPFVDVALVLLIIFMITAHVMEYGIEIDVPKTKTVASSTKDLPVVQISKSGDIYLGKDPVNINLLVRRSHQISRPTGRLSARRWGDAVRSHRECDERPRRRQTGVNVVTQPDDNIGRRRR